MIEEKFRNGPYISRLGTSMTFEWYSKCGGENAGINVKIYLINSRGSIVTDDFPFASLPLKTELVYDDGSPTPLMPFHPLKERRSSQNSSNPLYRILRSDPILSPQKTSQDFVFRSKY